MVCLPVSFPIIEEELPTILDCFGCCYNEDMFTTKGLPYDSQA